MYKKTVHTLTLTLCMLFALANHSFASSDIKKASESTMQKYKQCLIEGDKNLINDILDQSFRAGIYQQPISSNMFVQFLDVMQMPDSIYWEDLQQEGEKNYRKVYYIFGDTTLSYNVTFANSGKLLYSDWVDQKGFGLFREKPSEYVTSIPFELKDNKIVVKAKLNNSTKVLNMIFDTGADGMALVKSLQDECNVQITREHKTNVPGGQMDVSMSENNTLVFDSLSIPKQNLVLFEHIWEGIDGLIGGSNLFRSYITEVDFENKQFKLYTLGKFSPSKEYKHSSMTYANGVPTVELNIYKDNHKFKSEFIYDTGAAYSAILFGSGMKLLEPEGIRKVITPQYYSRNQSLGFSTQISIGRTDSICFSNMCFENTNFAMESYNPKANARHNVMGSIGVKSLSKFNWIIDLVSYSIYTAPNSSTNLPMDFAFDGYLLGFENQQLKVVRPVDKERNEELEVGDVILSLGGVKSDKLTAAKLSEILSKKRIKLNVAKSETGEVKKLQKINE